MTDTQDGGETHTRDFRPGPESTEPGGLDTGYPSELWDEEALVMYLALMGFFD